MENKEEILVSDLSRVLAIDVMKWATRNGLIISGVDDDANGGLAVYLKLENSKNEVWVHCKNDGTGLAVFLDDSKKDITHKFKTCLLDAAGYLEMFRFLTE